VGIRYAEGHAEAIGAALADDPLSDNGDPVTDAVGLPAREVVLRVAATGCPPTEWGTRAVQNASKCKLS
jgi:hypothetical protein